MRGSRWSRPSIAAGGLLVPVLHTQYTMAENERKPFQVATEIANEQTGRSLGIVRT